MNRPPPRAKPVDSFDPLSTQNVLFAAFVIVATAAYYIPKLVVYRHKARRLRSWQQLQQASKANQMMLELIDSDNTKKIHVPSGNNTPSVSHASSSTAEVSRNRGMHNQQQRSRSVSHEPCRPAQSHQTVPLAHTNANQSSAHPSSATLSLNTSTPVVVLSPASPNFPSSRSSGNTTPTMSKSSSHSSKPSKSARKSARSTLSKSQINQEPASKSEPLPSTLSIPAQNSVYTTSESDSLLEPAQIVKTRKTRRNKQSAAVSDTTVTALVKPFEKSVSLADKPLVKSDGSIDSSAMQSHLSSAHESNVLSDTKPNSASSNISPSLPAPINQQLHEHESKKKAFAEALRQGERKVSVSSESFEAVNNSKCAESLSSAPPVPVNSAAAVSVTPHTRKVPVGFADSRQPICSPAPLQFGNDSLKASSSSLTVPMNRRGSTSSVCSNNSGSFGSSSSTGTGPAHRGESISSQSSRKNSSSKQGDAPPRYDSLSGRSTDPCRSPSESGPRSGNTRARRSSNYRNNQPFMSPTYSQHMQSPILAQHQSTAMAQQHAVYAMALQQQYSKAVQQLQQHQMLQNGINQMSAGGIGQPQVLLDQLASQLTQAEDYVRSLSTQLMQAQQQLQMHQDQVRQQQAYSQFMTPTTPHFFGMQTTPYCTPLQTPITTSHSIKTQPPQSPICYRPYAQAEAVVDPKQVADMVTHAIMRPKGDSVKNVDFIKENGADQFSQSEGCSSNGWNCSPLNGSQELVSPLCSPSKGGSQTASDFAGSDGLPQYDSGPGSLYAGSSISSLEQRTSGKPISFSESSSLTGDTDNVGLVSSPPPLSESIKEEESRKMAIDEFSFANIDVIGDKVLTPTLS